MHFYSIFSIFFIQPDTMRLFVKMNGIYDILCAMFLLYKSPLYKFSMFHCIQYPHLTMLREPHKIDPMAMRMFAYWIFTYGIIRIFDMPGSISIRATYGIEAICIANETLNKKTMDITNGILVIFTCIGLMLA